MRSIASLWAFSLVHLPEFLALYTPHGTIQYGITATLSLCQAVKQQTKINFRSATSRQHPEIETIQLARERLEIPYAPSMHVNTTKQSELWWQTSTAGNGQKNKIESIYAREHHFWSLLPPPILFTSCRTVDKFAKLSWGKLFSSICF